MKRMKFIVIAAVLAVSGALSFNAMAQETNVSERTFLTFSNAFELPGLSLQPGTYVFKLADSPSRNVVQVWDREEKNMLGHWLFVQADRPQVTDDNVVMFRETPAGTPPAVQYWYFPGERIGKEFIYPKDQAARIARATGSKVLTAESDGASVSSIDADGRTTEWKRESSSTASAEGVGVVNGAPLQADRDPQQSQVQTQSANPAPAPTAQAESDVRTPAPVEETASARSEERSVGTSGQNEGQVARAEELPQTASPLALTGLLGLLSLAGAAGVRAYRK
jgi:hypothetical protein